MIEEHNNATPNAHIETLPTRRPGQHPDGAEKQLIQGVFLESFATMANVSAACDLAGVDRSTIYRWLHEDQDFASRWEVAEERANDVLKREAWRRAVQGIDEPVISMGKVVRDEDGSMLTVKKYDTPLLMMLMRARMPEYREKSQMDLNATATINQVSATAHQVLLDVRGMTTDELTQARALAQAMKEREEQRNSNGSH